MSDDLIERLRGYGDGNNDLMDAAADRIENLEEEVDILISASIRLASRIDIDSDAHADRIEKLEAALREIVELTEVTGKGSYLLGFTPADIAREALEGKGC